MRVLSMAIGFLFSLSDGRLHSYFYSSDRRGTSRLSATALASDSGTTVKRELRTETGEAGGNRQAGRRRNAQARHSDCAGQIRTASSAAGSATTVGPDVLRTQLRFSTRTLGPSSGGTGAEEYRRRLQLGG